MWVIIKIIVVYIRYILYIFFPLSRGDFMDA